MPASTPPTPLFTVPSTPAESTARVMLLSLWAPPAARWHARLVEADAHVHEFESPFELARFLAQPASAPPQSTLPTPAPAGSGLR